MSWTFFALISRMKHIGRWGLMRSVTPENIQEHSHMVAVLAHALAVIRNRIYGGHADPDRCAVYALYHDAPEILTGDLPTPVKYYNPAIKDAYKAIEQVSAQKLTNLLPPEFREVYAPLLSEQADPETYELLKAADKLAAYIKCVEELHSGNQEFAQAEAQIREALDKADLPELRYFMEHFLPAFGLSLDELQ